MSNIQLTEVTAATERIKLRLRRTAEDIVAIGQDLILIKNQLPHGQFMPWIQQHFERKQQTANNFISVASRFGSNSQLLGISPTALYELAAPSTPEEVINQVTEKAQAGESVSVAEVKALKQQVKEEQQAKQQAIQELQQFTQTAKQNEQVQAQAQAKINQLLAAQEQLNKHIDMLQNRPPDVVEKEVIKEIIPDGYKSAQDAINDLQEQRKDLNLQVLEHRQTLMTLKQQSNDEGKALSLRRELRIMCSHIDKTFAQIAERQTLVLSDPFIQSDPDCQDMLKQAHETLLHWAKVIDNAGNSVNITPSNQVYQILPIGVST